MGVGFRFPVLSTLYGVCSAQCYSSWSNRPAYVGRVYPGHSQTNKTERLHDAGMLLGTEHDHWWPLLEPIAQQRYVDRVKNPSAMAFSKAARFSGRKSLSTPGPGTYNPQTCFTQPRVLACTFAPPNREAKLKTVDVTKFRLTDTLGDGGLGTVHGGTLHGRAVAVKLFRQQPGLVRNPDTDRQALHEAASYPKSFCDVNLDLQSRFLVFLVDCLHQVFLCCVLSFLEFCA